MTMHDVDVTQSKAQAGPRWVPVTGLARLGLGLGALGFLLMPAWMLFGALGALPQLMLMAAGGACSLVAIIRRRERAILAFAGLAPLVLVVVFVVGEFAAPH
ncbi:MAG: hypothetical protein ACR2J9_04375 [Gaiellales bacterium]